VIETYYIGAYWGIRKETREQCAQRATQFLTCLRPCDSSFSRWFRKGRTREEALKHEVTPEVDSLRDLLLAHSSPNAEQKVIEDLGFYMDLWTGGSDEASTSLSLTCGSCAPRPGVNSCVINMPYASLPAENLLTVPALTSVVHCLVAAWQPDWAVVNSNAYLERTLTWPPKSPRTGWMLYLSRKLGKVPPLPPPVQVLSIDNEGSLIVVTNERFTDTNSTHVQTATRVRDILDHAGMLGPPR